MGGDNGPSAIVAGVANAAKSNSKIRFIINGDKSILDPLILKRKVLENICEVRHTKDIISMDDKPHTQCVMAKKVLCGVLLML